MRTAMFFVLLAGVVLGGCVTDPTMADASPGIVGPLLQTDRSEYTARRGSDTLADGTLYAHYVELDLRLRYTNRTGGRIYLPRCRSVAPPRLEKQEGSSWIIAFAPIVQACLGAPVVLQPGQVYDYRYPLRGYLPGSRVYPQFETPVPGTYRLAWTAYETWTPNSGQGGLGREAPLSARVSNAFQVLERELQVVP